MRFRTIILFPVFLTIIVSGGEIHAQNSMTVTGDFLMGMSTMAGEEFSGIDVDPAPVVGSSALIIYERVVFGGSLHFGSFQWNYDDFDQFHTTRRSDFTIQAGYAMSSNLYLYAAAKEMRFTGNKDNFQLQNPLEPPFQAAYAVNYQGMLLGGGIAALMQFPDSPFFLKWSAAYLTGDLELNKSADDIELEGFPRDISTTLTDIFIGLGYRLESGLGLIIGYKAAFAGEKQGEERIHGVMTSLFYDFGI